MVGMLIKINFTFKKFNFFRFSEKNIILCILKGNMPFEIHKIMFFPGKKLVTRNTLIFIIWPNDVDLPPSCSHTA